MQNAPKSTVLFCFDCTAAHAPRVQRSQRLRLSKSRARSACGACLCMHAACPQVRGDCCWRCPNRGAIVDDYARGRRPRRFPRLIGGCLASP
jgi:hypothetical protein